MISEENNGGDEDKSSYSPVVVQKKEAIKMFSWLKKKEKPVKTIISNDLTFVIHNSKDNEEVKGIVANSLALISVKKVKDQIAVGIEIERNLDKDIFTETHKTIVYSADDATTFFRNFGVISDITWIGEHNAKYHRRVPLTKAGVL